MHSWKARAEGRGSHNEPQGSGQDYAGKVYVAMSRAIDDRRNKPLLNPSINITRRPLLVRSLARPDSSELTRPRVRKAVSPHKTDRNRGSNCSVQTV